MELVKKDLEDIIASKRIYTVYQPVVSLTDGEILGYEALSRISEPQMIDNPEELFRMAETYQKVWEVDSLCRKKAIKRLASQTDEFDKKLFLNVNPMVLADQEFKSGYTQNFLEECGLSPAQVVIEITEQSAVKDMQEFSCAIRHYINQSYEIAIDDAGSCYSGLNLICDIRPRYLKLDRQLIQEIDKDNVKYAMVKSLVDFSKLVSIRLIAEGIETEKELKTLIKLGVPYGQGFFLARPSTELGSVKKTAMKIIDRNTAAISADDAGGGENFRVVLFGMNNAKAIKGLSKKYGEEKFQEMFLELKNTIQRNLEEEEILKSLTENDILAVVEKGRVQMVVETVLSQFEKELEKIYSEKEIKNEVIKVINKRGEEKKYPILRLDAEEIL